ncbi:hypothetical protein [Novipirellula artificiosorum]|uniref:Uncharacterized protein n=1 Tax=Novipirellula artificiosorum TaxID=2528016 RepID=A0A5C6D8T2_9BACT|nr:hypothetical protein [Novipirellula artificiosorum]TWU31606.1 hypothetical protein Poly41_61630 [Novipirellula artificiosorum]
MNIHKQDERDAVFLKLFLKGKAGQVSDEEVHYFRDHPDQIDEVSAPVKVHLIFLWAGGLLGVAFVALSKWFKFSQVTRFLSEGSGEFVIDIVFEIGVALIGAAVTAYILGILLNQQQEKAAKWRTEIRRRIHEIEG